MCKFEGNNTERLVWKNNSLRIRIRYRYKYDKRGNWIEREQEQNFPNSNVDPTEWLEGETEYRDITYHDR